MASSSLPSRPPMSFFRAHGQHCRQTRGGGVRSGWSGMAGSVGPARGSCRGVGGGGGLHGPGPRGSGRSCRAQCVRLGSGRAISGAAHPDPRRRGARQHGGDRRRPGVGGVHVPLLRLARCCADVCDELRRRGVDAAAGDGGLLAAVLPAAVCRAGRGRGHPGVWEQAKAESAPWERDFGLVYRRSGR